MPSSSFIRAHLGVISAMDFFTVEVLTLAGLVRHYVLFVIDVATRRVEIAGIIGQPHGEWMKQVARNLTDGASGIMNGMRYLIHDREPLFAREFHDILRSSGVTCIKLPARSPDLNAFAERFVLSIKSECLAKIVPLGERHLRRAIAEYVEHYHSERNHQGLENHLIAETAMPANSNRPVVRRARLGGISTSTTAALRRDKMFVLIESPASATMPKCALVGIAGLPGQRQVRSMASMATAISNESAPTPTRTGMVASL